MDTLADRARDIRLLVLDVDGVLTDGRLYFSARGEEMKSFHVRDGAGIVALLRAGIHVAVISGRHSEAVARRMSELGVMHVRQGIQDKGGALQELLGILNVTPQALACIGDDVPDLPLFAAAHLAVGVADAHPAVAAQAHYITRARGGEGAVREVCDLIIDARGRPP
ncbi:3-deoxy-D-manno-octulosonate 8-phosphate phosphatase [Steroidobacter denitrificans]|uniref:3-deoxy-D-manno-octulosonate 8-phosphate phosphatase KdsC n=1 Tax=Steroidobacter denitrificans TaxID=465721 RepID=A0A127F6V4_STEDE|nr:3-deoxy-D-manno-octulosonate 8-phosphate phosphatase [Steroidobacter denitrificans]